jgi:hypothetical protein
MKDQIICWIFGHKPVVFSNQDYLMILGDAAGRPWVKIQACLRCGLLYWEPVMNKELLDAHLEN